MYTTYNISLTTIDLFVQEEHLLHRRFFTLQDDHIDIQEEGHRKQAAMLIMVILPVLCLIVLAAIELKKASDTAKNAGDSERSVKGVKQLYNSYIITTLLVAIFYFGQLHFQWPIW